MKARTSRRRVLRGLAGGTATLVLGTVLIACGQSTPPTATTAAATKPAGAAATTPTGTAPAAKPASAAPASPPASTGAASALDWTTADAAAARKEGEVSLYTSLDTAIVDAVLKPFQEQTGVKVNYYRTGAQPLAAKVLQEADAGKVMAEVLDVSDVASILTMQQRGLLEAYKSKWLEKIPTDLRDKGDSWAACRLTQGCIQWNTQKLDGPAPKSWKDLTDPRFQGKLSFYADAGGPGPRFLALVTAFGWDWLTAVGKLSPIFVDSPQNLTALIERGERVVGFDQNDNIAWRSKDQGKPTDFVFPAEGVPTDPGVVALMKGATHPQAARMLVDWWISEPGQKLLVAGGKYSSHTDLDPPKGMPPLKGQKLLSYDYLDWQKNRQDIVKRFGQALNATW